jgi:hypothetical protein
MKKAILLGLLMVFLYSCNNDADQNDLTQTMTEFPSEFKELKSFKKFKIDANYTDDKKAIVDAYKKDENSIFMDYQNSELVISSPEYSVENYQASLLKNNVSMDMFEKEKNRPRNKSGMQTFSLNHDDHETFDDFDFVNQVLYKHTRDGNGGRTIYYIVKLETTPDGTGLDEYYFNSLYEDSLGVRLNSVYNILDDEDGDDYLFANHTGVRKIVTIWRDTNYTGTYHAMTIDHDDVVDGFSWSIERTFQRAKSAMVLNY